MIKKVLWTAAAAVTLTACDSNFDLSDIDKEVQFKAADLTVPLNVEPITLDAVLDLDDNSKIVKDRTNNTYSFQDSGTFQSNGVSVQGFQANGKTTSETEELQFETHYTGSATSVDGKIPSGTLLISGDVPEKSIDFSYSSDNVD